MSRQLDCDVAVVGGGLAGITAALRLADAGRKVVIVEAKPRLGGLTASFTRRGPVGPLTVDTGQHVFLRCCTAYLGLLDRLGMRQSVVLQDRLDVPVLRTTDGRRGRLRRNGLPVVANLPLHLAGSLLAYRLLPLRDRLGCARAIRAFSGLDPQSGAVDRQAFGDWLAIHGQTTAAVESLWELIGVATLNARAADASLALAATVFRLGLLSDPGAADIGWAAVPLGELHGAAAESELRAAGAELRLRARTSQIVFGGSSREWTVKLSDGSPVTAGAVVVATDPSSAERLLPPGAVSLGTGWSGRLGATPIINAHFVFDRTVLGDPLLALPGSPLQFLFDRSESSGLSALDGRAQHVVASVSAADGFAGRPVAELRAAFTAELRRALPETADAQLLDFFVTREPRATWRQAPGQAAHRPPTATRLPGLVLAGAHVATGWPATMEGAVRSGEAAAAHLLAAADLPEHPTSYPSPTEDAAA
jgi:squalene-associated FAD-dependent desaturase